MGRKDGKLHPCPQHTHTPVNDKHVNNDLVYNSEENSEQETIKASRYKKPITVILYLC